MMFTNHFRTRSTTVGGGAEGEKFGFSASATFKGALETLHQDNRTVAEVKEGVLLILISWSLVVKC